MLLGSSLSGSLTSLATDFSLAQSTQNTYLVSILRGMNTKAGGVVEAWARKRVH